MPLSPSVSCQYSQIHGDDYLANHDYKSSTIREQSNAMTGLHQYPPHVGWGTTASQGGNRALKNLSRFRLPTASVAAAFMLASGNLATAHECAPISELEAYAVSKTAPAGATCSTFLSEAALTGVSCYWEFPFRDDKATLLAKSLWSIVQQCHPGVEKGPDQLVNHPDSYDLRNWISGNKIFHVSVKDKGQLERTLVFLRLEKTGS